MQNFSKMAVLHNYYEVTIDKLQVLAWGKPILLSHLLLKLIVMAFRVLKKRCPFPP
jgi:hypothetical protein